MKPLVTVLIIGFALVIGCGPKPNFGPNDVVTIHGSYKNVDGSTYAKKSIGIWKLDLEGASVTNFWYPDPDSKDISDSTGAYEFEYKGSDLTWGSGNSKYVILANTDSMSGPVVALGFYPMTTDELMPTVKLWNGQPQVTVAGDSAVFTWQGLDDAQGITPDKYAFSAAVQLWFDLWREDSIPNSTKTYHIPTFVFQNQSSGWRIEAPINSPVDTAVDFNYFSTVNTQPLSSTAPQLLSQGRPCYAQGSDTTVFTKMTNSVWHEDEYFNNTHPTYFLIDLGVLKYVRAVAVYGLASSYPAQAQHGGFEIYVAEDTTDFGSPVATTTRDKGYFYFQFAPAQGRWVKLSRVATSNLNVTSLKEIGVFGD
jgi:hypothetical protein